jgi:metal-responsive CopG/Arc/MetJ family transcriptional regulator
MVTAMTTVQMTLEPELVAEVDRVSRQHGLTRSAFTRRALREALDRLRILDLERRQREGYRRTPVRRDEFADWTREKVWPE